MNQQQSHPIDRRTFLAMGLAVPIGTLADTRQADSPGLFPVSMDRCVVITGVRDRRLMTRRLAQYYEAPERLDEWATLLSERASPTWHCEIAHGVRGHLVRDWWLLVSQSANCKTQLTVIQALSASPLEADLAGLLAARVTHRLHALQRRGSFQGDFNRYRIVQRVNQQIVRAMDNMPI